MRITTEQSAKQEFLRQRQTIAKFKRDGNNQAGAMADVRSAHRLQELWDFYVGWLHANDLALLPQNLRTLDRYADYRHKLRDLTEANVTNMAQELSEAIAATEFPREPDEAPQ